MSILTILRFALCLAVVFSLCCGQAFSADLGRGSIGVVYIDSGEPALKIIPEIIAGIEARRSGIVTRIPFKPGGLDLVQGDKTETKYVVALGKEAFNNVSAYPAFSKTIPAFTLSPAEGAKFSTLSLAVSPDVMFSLLHRVAPDVRRVWTVYNSRQSDWIIRLARSHAESMGLELLAVDVADSASAVRAWREILSKASPDTDSIWFPQDSVTVDRDVVVPLVLGEGWNRSLIVFSSSVSHVSRGALFGFYPDYVAYGGTIYDFVASLNSGATERRTIIPLRDVNAAWNTRMAERIGIRISEALLRSFKRFYPER